MEGVESVSPARLFGARVKEFRKERGLNQTQLGLLSGTGQSMVSRIELGTYPLKGWDIPDRLAAALGCTTDELVGDTGFVPRLKPTVPRMYQIWG